MPEERTERGALEQEVERLRARISELEALLAQQERAGAIPSKSEARLRLIADTIESVFWMTDWTSHATVFASPAFERIWGRSLERLYCNPSEWADAIHPDDREWVWERFVALGEADRFDEEYRIVLPDGATRWIRDRGFPVRDEDGRTTHAVGIAEDITLRKRAQDELRRSEAELRAIYENTPLVMFVVNRDRRILKMNAAALAMSGLPASLAVGLRGGEALRCIHALDDPRGCGFGPDCSTCGVRLAVLETLDSGQGVQRRQASFAFGSPADATGMQLLISSAVLGELDEEAVLVCLEDITERVLAEQDLAHSEALHRTTVDALADALHLVDRDLRIQLANQALRDWCRLLGLPEETEGVPLREAFPMLPDAVLGEYRQVFASGLPLRTEEQLELRGRAVVAEIRKIPVTDGGGVRGVLTIVRDITEHRQAERELIHAQKMQAIGQLAGGVAHDMNNMLAGIMGYASLAQMELKPEDQMAADMGEILEICKRARELTGNLLGFARKGKFVVERLDLNQAVERVCAILERTIPKGITIAVRPCEAATTVEGDPAQLEQVLMNLCINAADAMGERGVLTLTTRLTDLNATGPAPAAELRPGRYVELRVSDTGVGMAAEVAARAFEPFYTTKPRGRGTGLGLPMVYGAVENHGGAVSLASDPGQGTTVTVWLPACEGTASERRTERPESQRATPVAKGTILLVDDEEPVRTSAARILERLGYRVLLAADGVAALALYRALARGIDLVLLDLAMPVMDGAATFRGLREIDPSVRVLIVSGFSNDATAERLLGEGAVGYVQKPATSEALAAAVVDALDGIRAGLRA